MTKNSSPASRQERCQTRVFITVIIFKMVWLYLDRHPVLEALVRFSDALKRFAATHGKPNLYH